MTTRKANDMWRIKGIIGKVSITILLFNLIIVPAESAPVADKAAKELSCSKQARRIHKITDRKKKRAFIAQCQAEREARLKAKQEAQRKKKLQKKAKEKAADKAFLQGK